MTPNDKTVTVLNSIWYLVHFSPAFLFSANQIQDKENIQCGRLSRTIIFADQETFVMGVEES